MKKSLFIEITVLILIIIGLFGYIKLTTPNPFNEKEFPKTQEMAKEIAIEYFKEEKQLDVVITEVGITGEIGYKVWVEGHVLNDEQKKISAIIEVGKKDRYEVISSKID